MLQLVAVQEFPAPAAAVVHDATGVGPVTTVLQTTVADGTQAATPLGAVQPQVVAVHGGVVVALALTGVQPSGALVGPEADTGQVVVTQPFADEAAAGVHEPVGVGPVTAVPQVVAV